MATTVLVVDDYPDARLLLSYLLADAGFQIIHAESGPQAIALTRERRPAAIVMDLNLPGMSGIDTTRRLREDPDLAGIPVIAHTLSPRPMTEEEVALFDGVLAKPTLPESLVEMLRRAIRRAADA